MAGLVAQRVGVAVVGLLAVIVGGVGIAVATIPDGDGVIHACIKRGGTLRVVDTDSGQSCTPKEKALSWNEAGQAGADGSTVLWWQPIYQFQESGAAVQHELDCPAGYQAIGAGYSLEGDGRLGQAVTRSYGSDDTWVIALEPTGAETAYNLTVRVECFDGLTLGDDDD